GQQAARVLQDSLSAWRAPYPPSVVLQAAVIAAAAGTRENLILIERNKPQPKPAAALRRTRPKEPTYLVLKSVAVEYTPGGQPVIRLELAHNSDSRQVVTQFSNLLSKDCPPGYQFNFRPVEHANMVQIETTWRLQ
ncbi:MAG: hypothetical protein PHE83_18480, partial [Opitutaceae bacterium]|nr:hypothetical protein [Opitutaceae bacterium]